MFCIEILVLSKHSLCPRILEQGFILGQRQRFV